MSSLHSETHFLIEKVHFKCKQNIEKELITFKRTY
jgi:hypothetical protein